MAVHRELVSAGKFDEKFRRALLDYYGYGYKPLASYDNWRRLNGILADYLDWAEEPGGVRFASADSEQMEENPFHRVYRFCKYKPVAYPATFLHTLALLSGEFSLRALPAAVQENEERQMHLEDVLAAGGPFKTADLLALIGAGEARTLNNRLDDLAALGILVCEQQSGSRGGAGNRYWRRGQLTLAELVRCGEAVDVDFAQHLQTFLQFYGETLPCGVLGTFLLDRLGETGARPFRFKHAYFMQALHDFTAVDLLAAMEQGLWCRVVYRHGTSDLETELLCWPLELRRSTMQGRSHLLFYEPEHRSLASLRLEFIDAVYLYEDAAVRDCLGREAAELDADIARARAMLPYVWGSSTGRTQAHNAAASPALQEVALCIRCDAKEEPYIARRLLRECRGGRVTFDERAGTATLRVTVCDAKEMRPWLRSFYGRILSCEGLEDVLAEDVAAMAAGHPQQERASGGERWQLSPELRERLGAGTQARTHEQLFNEVFSVYYQIMAEVFCGLSAEEDAAFCTEAELDARIRAALGAHYLKLGSETEHTLPQELVQTLLGGDLVERGSVTRRAAQRCVFKGEAQTVAALRSRYQCAPGLRFYRDVVPLSVLELRWLAAALADKRRACFFSDAETRALQALLAEKYPQLAPLALEKIVMIDRFHFPAEALAREQQVLPQILAALAQGRDLALCYRTRFAGRRCGRYTPLVLVYSLRDDRFQGRFCADDGEIVTLNLARIESVQLDAPSVGRAQAAEQATALRQAEWRAVTVQFADVRNLADRILTEFSPWQKRCSFDAEAGRYTLTLAYQQRDVWDITVRLMGYGAGIRFADPEHEIAREVARRVREQARLFGE